MSRKLYKFTTDPKKVLQIPVLNSITIYKQFTKHNDQHHLKLEKKH